MAADNEAAPLLSSLDILRWHIEMDIDEVIDDQPINRYARPTPLPTTGPSTLSALPPPPARPRPRPRPRRPRPPLRRARTSSGPSSRAARSLARTRPTTPRWWTLSTRHRRSIRRGRCCCSRRGWAAARRTRTCARWLRPPTRAAGRWP